MTTNSRCKVLVNTIRIAGEVVKKAVPSYGITEKEGRGNFVTAADLASEKMIIDSIRNEFPQDSILSEETQSNTSNPLHEGRLWVIDPIDGTNNFRFQRNHSAVSIGYIEKGVIKAGAVYNPFRDELFYAEQGKGAYLNNQIIKTSNLSELSKSVIAADNSYDPKGTRQVVETFLKVEPSPWLLIRGCAVLAMCEVAAGRIDLYFHIALKPWDNAAAFLIAQESGAVVKDVKGNDVNFLSENVVLGNVALVDQFIDSVNN